MLYSSNDGRIVVVKATTHANDHIKATNSKQERLMIELEFEDRAVLGRKLS